MQSGPEATGTDLPQDTINAALVHTGSAMTSSERLSMRFSNVGHSFSHLFMLLYPTALLGLEAELGMSYAELIALLTAGNVLFGLGALPAGWLGDRWDALRMMVLFFVGLGVASILTGLMSSAIGIGSGLALMGLFASIYHPVGIAWLVRNARSPGRVLGVNGVFGSLGIASASLIAGLLTDLISWRAAFIVPGAACTITGLLLWRYIGDGTIVARQHDVQELHRDTPVKGRSRVFVVLTVAILCGGMMFQALSVVMPKLFAERLLQPGEFSALGAGGLVSLVYLIAAAAQVLGGYLADRHTARSVYVGIYAILTPLLLVAAGMSGYGLVAVLAAIVFLQTGGIPVENVLLARYSPPDRRGTVYGVKFVIAFGLAALAVPMVAALYEFAGGFFWVLVTLGGLAAVVALVSMFLPAVARPASLPLPFGR